MQEDDNDPIPMRLHCPECFTLHIDEGMFATKLHATHACQNCGNVWRPAIVNTVGVKFLPGYKNEETKDGVDPSPASQAEELYPLLWMVVVCSGLIGDKDVAPNDVMTTADDIVKGFKDRFIAPKKGK